MVIPTINPIISLAINQRSPIVWGPLPVPDINEAMPLPRAARVPFPSWLGLCKANAYI